MKTTARLLLSALIATAIAGLAGCASHPELRPYTAEETQELQLEALARQSLSFDEFKQRKAAVLRADTVEGVVDAMPPHTGIKG